MLTSLREKYLRVADYHDVMREEDRTSEFVKHKIVFWYKCENGGIGLNEHDDEIGKQASKAAFIPKKNFNIVEIRFSTLRHDIIN